MIEVVACFLSANSKLKLIDPAVGGVFFLIEVNQSDETDYFTCWTTKNREQRSAACLYEEQEGS